MPPSLNIPEEAVKAAIKSALEREQRRDISKKAITLNIASFISLFIAIIGATAFIVRKMDTIERGRWTVGHEHAAWEQAADLNPDLKLKKPPIYAIQREMQNQ